MPKWSTKPARKGGETPLFCAVAGTNPFKMVRLLLDRGADASVVLPRGTTLLGHYIELGLPYTHHDILPILMETAKATDYIALSRDGESRNALHLAAWAASRFDGRGVQSLAMLRSLLEYREMKARINDGATPDGFTALLSACHNLSYGASRLLIEAGADVSLTTPSGRSPLVLALTQGMAVSQQAEGKGLSFRKARLDAAFMLACYLTEVMRGSHLDRAWTPLHLAAILGHVEQVSRIVEEEPEATLVEDAQGYTPRLWLLMNGLLRDYNNLSSEEKQRANQMEEAIFEAELGVLKEQVKDGGGGEEPKIILRAWKGDQQVVKRAPISWVDMMRAREGVEERERERQEQVRRVGGDT